MMFWLTGAILKINGSKKIAQCFPSGIMQFLNQHTVVPALDDPRRERAPGVYGQVINVPTHLNVTLPAIGGHLPNADADSYLLVKKSNIARGAHPKATDSSLNLPCCHLMTANNISYRESGP